MSDGPQNPFKAGYRQPPKEHQFQKGKSGNPGGRPKKVPTARETIARQLAELLPARDGQPRMSKMDLVVALQIKEAMQDPAFGLKFLRFKEGYDPPDEPPVEDDVARAQREIMDRL